MQKKLTLISLILLIGCSTNNVSQKSPKKKKAELYYSQGTAELVKKDYTKALINLKEAVKLDSDNSKVHNNLGMAYYFKGDQTSAFKHLKKSLELDSKNSDARNNLASILVSNNQLEQAKKQYLLVLKDLEYPHQYRTYYNLASIAIKQGEAHKAFKYLESSLNEKNTYCPALFQKGVLLYKKSFFVKALEAFQKSSSGTCAKDPAPRYHQALAYIALNRPDQALLKLREVIEAYPSSSYALLAKTKIQNLEFSEVKASKQKLNSTQPSL